MKKKLVLLVVVLLLFTYLYKQYIHTSFLDRKKDTPVPVKKLSGQEFKKLNDQLAQTVEKQDPRVALELLAQDSKKSNAVADSCHLLAHDIGHEAFKKYKSFGVAMQYQNEVCNSGYMHGVIESYFSTSKTISSEMLTVCSGYKPGSFISWECYHGLGHGLMYFTNNNVPVSLSKCNFNEGDFGSSACVNGVFMENFNTDPDQKTHASSYLHADDPFYPCDKEATVYKENCYIYSPVYYLGLHNGAYKDALAWCLSAEAGYQRLCTEGVGSEAMKQNINNPKLVEQICRQGSGEQTSECITGMVEIYIFNFGSLNPARSLCNQLSGDNKATCGEVVQEESSLFD